MNTHKTKKIKIVVKYFFIFSSVKSIHSKLFLLYFLVLCVFTTSCYSSEASEWHRKGVSYYDNGLYGKAIECFSESIKLNSDNPNAYFGRGDAYFATYRLEEAISDYTKVISYYPNSPSVYYWRGRSYNAAREFEKAISDYDKAIDHYKKAWEHAVKAMDKINGKVRVNKENEIEGVVESVIPTEFVLKQNYPNPFNPTTTIQYSLTKDGRVTVQVYDILGELVTVLVNTEKSAGMHSVIWNGTNAIGELVPSGIYLSRVMTNKEVKTITMMYLK